MITSSLIELSMQVRFRVTVATTTVIVVAFHNSGKVVKCYFQQQVVQ
jgi:hypothetical protein